MKENPVSKEVASLSKYIELIEDKAKNDGKRLILYRGQNCDKVLIPKIARHLYKSSRKANEIRMFEEFKRSAYPHLVYKPENDLEWLSVAQHYGIPTRLLDWTENPLAALYFAVCNKSIESENSVVWVFSVDLDNEIFDIENKNEVFNNKTIKLFKPKTIVERVSSQFGWFSHHPLINSSMYEKFENLKDYPNARLQKIIIKKNMNEKILQTLEACGINKFTIFRDLDSLGSHIFFKNLK